MLEIDGPTFRARLSCSAMRSAMRDGLTAFSAGKVWCPARVHWNFGYPDTSILLMAASSADLGLTVLKRLTIIEANKADGVPTIQGDLVVLDRSSGSAIARFNAETVTHMRTASCCAVATEMLSDPHASILALFGTGPQAREQIAALADVRPIKEVLLYGRNIEEARNLAETWSDEFDVAISAQRDRLRLSEAGIISTATASCEPLFEASDVSPFAHVNAIGSYRPEMCELDPRLMASSEIFVDCLAECVAGSGELARAFGEGAAAYVTELGEFLASARYGSRSRTIYKSVGSASQDLYAVAAYLGPPPP